VSLPEPSFVTRDPEAVTAEMVASWEATAGKTLYPGQVESLLIDLIAYRESLVRIAIQEAAKQNLVAYAIYPMLDYLGQLVGVQRIEGETDNQLRERIKLAPEAFSVAGSRLSYIYWARSSHASIVDVAVLSPAPGEVVIYPLTDSGTPDAEVLAAVLSTCSGEKVRPLTDQVSVAEPERADFQIALTITPYAWPDAAEVESQAMAALTAYATELRAALGKDVIRSQIIARVQDVYGVYKVAVTSPAADVERATHQWGDCTGIVITMEDPVDG
jgi:phage-related baseplate assembly protein